MFAEETNALYLLSFLLTASHEKAEQCFVAGLEQCMNGNPVSQAWARSWARRIIIRNAVQMLRAHARVRSAGSAEGGGKDLAGLSPHDAQFAAILALPDFERLVFVLSVLERYSDQDCAALLGTSRHEVLEGRLRALRQVAECERGSVAPGAYTGGTPGEQISVQN